MARNAQTAAPLRKHKVRLIVSSLLFYLGCFASQELCLFLAYTESKYESFNHTVTSHTVGMDSFEYNAAPSRVIFGTGTLSRLPEEVARLRSTKPLLLSTPQQVKEVETLKTILNGKIAGIFTEATMHTPSHVTDKALEFSKTVQADSVISIGGGSTIGLGKAISIRTGLPHICIPTTYAGSEMTPILGETIEGQKKTRTDSKILPGTVIYDTDLTMSLPALMSATSGVNAMAHASESLPLYEILLYDSFLKAVH
jgi:alcohol dehydrogenase class IV